jgi:hypothetical protein
VNVPGGPVYVPNPSPPVVVPDDPYLITPGTIEDGTHYGYLTSQGAGWFSFDRADVAADGTWTNVNSKTRTLPYANAVAVVNGAPVQVIVEDQRVVAVWAF